MGKHIHCTLCNHKINSKEEPYDSNGVGGWVHSQCLSEVMDLYLQYGGTLRPITPDAESLDRGSTINGNYNSSSTRQLVSGKQGNPGPTLIEQERDNWPGGGGLIHSSADK